MERLIRGLLRPEAYDHPVERFELLETHISWVILTGKYAYKIKKPVDFGFVNFTMLALREHFCQEELRLNRRLAEDIYLGVVPIYGPMETPSLQGSGTPIEYAVKMLEFPQSVLLPEVLALGELLEELIDHLAHDVAQFQTRAAIANSEGEYGSPESILSATLECLKPLASSPELEERIQKLDSWTAEEFSKLTGSFLERRAAGFVREGHGDMHLGNMLLRGTRIEIFDCLEFNASLRWIDGISEVAFLVMDLEDRGRGDLGWRFLNGWLEETGDYAGMRLWNWYYCYRALVRAKVAFLRLGQSDLTAHDREKLNRELTSYLELAERVTAPSKPRLVITSGVSGTGKSYWTGQLAARCEFVRLRSDVERKRLYADRPGISTGELYSQEATERTYSRLYAQAEALLCAGFTVVVDATFLRRNRREQFRELAKRLDVAAELIEFSAPVEVLQQRIRKRQQEGKDPSDADLQVLEKQLETREAIEPDEGWSVLSVSGDEPVQIEAALSKWSAR
ncbi:MAG: AAA family ATPase [Planctomycetaceae bacterium]|nr:AAA family ATPase [Planctomycetaceae bacterium]